MKRAVLFTLILVAAMVFVVAYAQDQESHKKAGVVTPEEAMKASVIRGKALFSDPSLGTNGKTCNDCHLDGGAKEGMMGKMVVKPFHEVNEEYPRYWMMADRVMTLDQVINWCIMTPLEGEPLKWDDQKLTDLAAYCASVKSPKEEAMEGDEEDDD
jgi:thiosulfate dehydrogenase